MAIPMKYSFHPSENVPFFLGIVECILQFYLVESDQVKIDLSSLFYRFIDRGLECSWNVGTGTRLIKNFIDADAI